MMLGIWLNVWTRTELESASSTNSLITLSYNNRLNYVLDVQILSKADDNTVMEAVDSEVSVTCVDMGLVRKAFQLALLCTKRHPSDRPTMHEVARVLLSLLPTAAPSLSKPSCLMPPAKAVVDYSKFVGNHRGDANDDDSSSDRQWFVRFGEVISKSTIWRGKGFE